MDFHFDVINDTDIDVVAQLEALSYPEDEAATPEKIRYRSFNARSYFLVAKAASNGDIVGFINATCIQGSVIHHESMSEHNYEGKTAVIHSVVTHPDHRRKGLASAMLQRYCQHIHGLKLADELLLLCKTNLLPLYLSAGFQFRQVSSVVHGKDVWIECGMRLADHFAIDQWQVDAFTNKAFGGNPAAVVLLHKDVSWMQNVAMENNLAETAFLQKLGDNRFQLRWFTPNTEVALCGHATLAAAHALRETLSVDVGLPVEFETVHSGVLTAKYLPSKEIQLSFPITPPVMFAFSSEDEAAFVSALGIQSSDILFVGKSIYDLFVEIKAEAFHKLDKINHSTLERYGGRGVIVTCSKDPTVEQADLKYDFFSRFFAPLCAINEDPVTGSTHCALCPYWVGRFGKSQLLGYQASARGGIVGVTLEGDRVFLTGTCVTTAKSKLFV